MRAVTELLRQLVSINSVNPILVPGAPGETELARFVSDWLSRLDADVYWIEPVIGRPSVLGRVRGSGGGRSIMLYAHLDTVGVEGMENPHTPIVRGEQLFGRGAYDMKSGLAAILLATAQLGLNPPPGDVWVMAVADEEHSSIGAQAALERLSELNVQIDGVIVTEPTDLKLCVAHRGFGWVTIKTQGRAAHTSRRGEGIDAIAHMGRVIVSLEQLDRDLQERPPHPLLGHGSVVASLINGGSELFTYPAHCQIELVRRTLPGESADTLTEELEHLLSSLEEADPQFSAALEQRLFRTALETPTESPIVETLAKSAEQFLGKQPQYAGASFWTDAALMAEAGIPPIIFGPCGSGPHADIEWVDLPSVKTCLEILVQTARTFCN